MKLAMMPTDIAPSTARYPPAVATMMKPMLVSTLSMGMTRPDQIWAFMPDWRSLALIASNRSTTRCSWPKALTTSCPDRISSTWPLSSARSICCWRNRRRVRLATLPEKNKVSGTVSKASPVKIGDRTSIMTSEPINMITLAKSCVVDDEIIVLTLSTSFARRLISSPWVRESKKANGRCCRRSNRDLRTSRMTRWATPAIHHS